MRKRQSTHQKRTTKPSNDQPSLLVVSLLFVGVLVVYLASNDQLGTNAVTALGAVTAALIVLIKTKR